MSIRAPRTLRLLNLALGLAALVLAAGLAVGIGRSRERGAALGSRSQLEQLTDLGIAREKLLMAHDEVLAADEAQALHHTCVGTEHIFLGLLREGDGVAARVLTGLNVNLEQTRTAILKELAP